MVRSCQGKRNHVCPIGTSSGVAERKPGTMAVGSGAWAELGTMGRTGRSLEVVLVESFWGGSHRAAAEGWARSSRHRVAVEHLPARFWKWRTRGAAFEFARRLRARVAAGAVDLVFASSLLDLAHLRAFLPRRVPAILYFHESQVGYPPRPGEEGAERDLQYAFTNLASALAADRVAFNSRYHRETFLTNTAALLRRMPDTRPLWALEEVAAKAEVVPLGVSLADIPARPGAGAGEGEPPVILWNHRWEYDKDPEAFFRVLLRLAERGIPFRVAVAGESFGRTPDVFRRVRPHLGERVVHWGYLAEREDYVRLLARADFVVSTAIQENFGLSVVEAAYAGAHPLAPRRLSYPEVLPAPLHEACLYDGEADLEHRLAALATGRTPAVAPDRLRVAFEGYRWAERAGAFDDLVEQVSGRLDLWYK